MPLIAAVVAALLAAGACGGTPPPPDTAKSKGGKETPVERWLLPDKLREISGLALTPDGRLFAHNDELGRVFEIDFRHGAIVKDFLVGTPLPVRADFEGITVAAGTMYLLASNGKLYEFKEGADGERVAYRMTDTGLGGECEFEGVAYEAATGSLVLACKYVRDPKLVGSLVLYRWKLAAGGGGEPRVTPITIPLAQAIGANPWRSLHPSDITIDPESGNFVLVASIERALLELTPAGGVVFSRPLPGHHGHAEGVAITKDHLLLISDEGRAERAAITLYRWP